MRFSKMLMALGTTLMLGTAHLALAQQTKIEVTTPENHAVWYTDPVWLGLGACVLLVIVVLMIMAARGKDTKSTTTVVR